MSALFAQRSKVQFSEPNLNKLPTYGIEILKMKLQFLWTQKISFHYVNWKLKIMNDPFLSRPESLAIRSFVYKNTYSKLKSFIFHLQIIYVWVKYTDSHFMVDETNNFRYFNLVKPVLPRRSCEEHGGSFFWCSNVTRFWCQNTLNSI